MCRALLVLLLVSGWAVAAASAQEVPRGAIVESVAAGGDASQTYALYVPTTYTPSTPAKLLVGFHPAARGQAIVALYRDAAEKYGYVLAASNTSRNGSWDRSGKAASAMLTDLTRRFAVDDRRIYLTGMSGGARVALWIAIASKAIAGVIASSAGYPDSRPRSSLPFVVFGTAGTDDFNYTEMRQLDRALKTPHRLSVFTGGHTLPPIAVATEAVEWLELQAMAAGLAARDDAFVARLFEPRQQAATAAGETAQGVRLLRELAADFKAFRDTSPLERQAEALAKRKDIKAALDRERDDEDAEARTLGEITRLEQELGLHEGRGARMIQLRNLLDRLWKQANAEVESPERSRARRVLSTVTAGASSRVEDQEYLTLLQQYRLARGPRG